MKICVAGKGGTGKTTISAVLARFFARNGFNVLAVDADPNTNLALSLGIPLEEAKKIVPISENKELIAERTGVAPGSSWGAIFNLVPDVRDIRDKYSVFAPDGVSLLVTGTIDYGGSGCFCPAAALLKALLSYIILKEKEIVIIDMEAGLEHLGRGVTKKVDMLITVIEPSVKATETAERIRKLAGDLDVKEIYVVVNKVYSENQSKLIRGMLMKRGFSILGEIPYDEEIVKADMKGKSPLDYNPDSKAVKAIHGIYHKLVKIIERGTV